MPGSDAAPEALQILAEVARSERPPIIGLRALGGAVSRIAADATAYAHRDAALLVVTTLIGPAPVVAAGRPGLDAVWKRLAPHVSGAYANFQSGTGPADVAAIYPEPTYARLAALKRQHDPENLFAATHNVRPA